MYFVVDTIRLFQLTGLSLFHKKTDSFLDHIILESQAKVMYKITEKDCYGERSKLLHPLFILYNAISCSGVTEGCHHVK